MPKSIRTSLLAAVIFLIAAVVLNPSAERDREKIKQGVAERSQLERVLGVGQLKAFVAEYKSIGVASYMAANGKVESVGFMGMVFVLD